MKEHMGEIVAFGIMQSRLGKADDVMERLREDLYRTRQMDGLKDAYIAHSLDDPGRFFTCSRWESMAHYDAVQEALSAGSENAGLYELLEGPPLWGAYSIIEP